MASEPASGAMAPTEDRCGDLLRLGTDVDLAAGGIPRGVEEPGGRPGTQVVGKLGSRGQAR